jgi:hypothetical protein
MRYHHLLISLGLIFLAGCYGPDGKVRMRQSSDGVFIVLNLPQNAGGYHIFFRPADHGPGQQVKAIENVIVEITQLGSEKAEVTWSPNKLNTVPLDKMGQVHYLEKPGDKISDKFQSLPNDTDIRASTAIILKGKIEMMIKVVGINDVTIEYESIKK